MAVPANIIVGWPGALSPLPAGWTVATQLQSRYPRCVSTGATSPGSTGGSAQHGHSAPNHTHNLAAHTHAGATNGATQLSNVVLSGAPATEPGQHSHTFTANSGGPDTTTSSEGGWDPTVAEPGFFTVTWLKSNGTPTGIPIGAICFFNANVVPVGFTQTAQNRFLKGADAGIVGAVAGGGWSHTHTGLDHTHGTTGHGHTAPTSGSSGDVTSAPPTAQTSSSSPVAHTHPITITTGGVNLAPSLDPDTTDADVQDDPPFTYLLAAQNSDTTPRQPFGMIALWLGTPTTVPAGWQLCDGTNGTPNLLGQFVKGVNSLADVGTTGGSNNPHGHTATGAGHVHPGAHTHPGITGSASASGPNVIRVATSATKLPIAAHTHNLTTDSGTAPDTDVAVETVDTASITPPYVEVLFIQKTANLAPSIPVLTTRANFAAILDAKFSWKYKDNNDPGNNQTAFQLQIYNFVTNALVFDTGKITTNDNFYTLPGNTLTAGIKYYWRVHVWGPSDQLSPWSLTSTFSTSALAGIVITYPANNGDTVATNLVTVQWTYTGAGGSLQKAYNITLTRSGAPLPEWSSGWITSTDANSLTIPDILINGTTYIITLSIRDTSPTGAAGVFTRTFVTTFPPLTGPVLTVTPDPNSGVVRISVNTGM